MSDRSCVFLLLSFKESRLRARGTEKEEDIVRRLKHAKEDLAVGECLPEYKFSQLSLNWPFSSIIEIFTLGAHCVQNHHATSSSSKSGR